MLFLWLSATFLCLHRCIAHDKCSNGQPAFTPCIFGRCYVDRSAVCESINGRLFCCPNKAPGSATESQPAPVIDPVPGGPGGSSGPPSSGPSTPVKTCPEVFADCTPYKYLCTHIIYGRMMTTICPSTCGTCKNIANECTDKFNDCSTKRELCNMPAYATVVNSYCRRTCGLCKK